MTSLPVIFAFDALEIVFVILAVLPVACIAAFVAVVCWLRAMSLPKSIVIGVGAALLVCLGYFMFGMFETFLVTLPALPLGCIGMFVAAAGRLFGMPLRKSVLAGIGAALLACISYVGCYGVLSAEGHYHETMSETGASLAVWHPLFCREPAVWKGRASSSLTSLGVFFFPLEIIDASIWHPTVDSYTIRDDLRLPERRRIIQLED